MAGYGCYGDLTLRYIYTNRYWAVIDDALRAAVYERGVTVRLMGSYWNHTDKDMVAFLASLSTIRGVGPFDGDIQTVSSFKLGVHPEESCRHCSPQGEDIRWWVWCGWSF